MRVTRATKEADELVLVDSDESSSTGKEQHASRGTGSAAAVEEWQDEPSSSAAGIGVHKAGSRTVQGEGSYGSSSLQRGGLGLGGSSGLAAESSKVRTGQFGGGLTAESSRARAGGWGTGSMAAAGTLMLGDEAEDSYSEDGGLGRAVQGMVPGFAAQDDVFGSDSPRAAAAGGGGLRPERNGRQHGSSRSHSGSGSVPQQQQQQQHAAAAAAVSHQPEDEQLGLEEIDDVDALIEAELAAKNALPGDLAAKLAAFEAMADDDE
jgi:hypothetical protein